MNLEKITVTMKDGNFAEWEKDEWDDYTYDGKFFIVMKNRIWMKCAQLLLNNFKEEFIYGFQQIRQAGRP